MEQYSFEKLLVYQSAKRLVVEVYRLMAKFPPQEKYALCDQLRRAIVSVPSNLAEGSGRMSVKEKIHFIEIAYASLMEAYCQLDIAKDLGYISVEDFATVKNKFFDCSRLMTAYRKSFVDKTQSFQ